MPKLEKSTDHSHILISSEDGQDTSAYKISGQSLHAFSGKCPETSPDGRTDRRTDGHAVKRLRLVGWTNGPMYRSKQGISGFGRTDGWTDGWTDGQPENIMPPAPKGGGIKKQHFTSFSALFLTLAYNRSLKISIYYMFILRKLLIIIIPTGPCLQWYNREQ